MPASTSASWHCSRSRHPRAVPCSTRDGCLARSRGRAAMVPGAARTVRVATSGSRGEGAHRETEAERAAIRGETAVLTRDAEILRSELETAQRATAAADERISRLEAEGAAIRSDAAKDAELLRNELQTARLALEATRRSTSWRITAPLRRAARVMRRLTPQRASATGKQHGAIGGNRMGLPVFVGWDTRETKAYQVCEHSRVFHSGAGRAMSRVERGDGNGPGCGCYAASTSAVRALMRRASAFTRCFISRNPRTARKPRLPRAARADPAQHHLAVPPAFHVSRVVRDQAVQVLDRVGRSERSVERAVDAQA